MRILLDEDVPLQLVEPLRHLLPEHQIDHVQEIRWKGKKDLYLLPDAGRRGYGAFVTHNSGQLDDAAESRAIRDSGMHHVRYHQDTRQGLDGLALAMASVLAAIRHIMRDLAAAGSQQLVEVQSIQSGKRHRLTDPRIDPPRYWPSRVGQPHRPHRRPEAD
jgi:hypothetical protein